MKMEGKNPISIDALDYALDDVRPNYKAADWGLQIGSSLHEQHSL